MIFKELDIIIAEGKMINEKINSLKTEETKNNSESESDLTLTKCNEDS